jgi:hypothetical protein
MIATGPPRNANALLAKGRRETLIVSAGYQARGPIQAGIVWAIWQREAARLFREFWRSGNAKHLRAFSTHILAMRSYRGLLK